jgi:coenzyme F420-0:L-glutamate ligase/coenzyme F420-1:gamma-L-glutamate ligase
MPEVTPGDDLISLVQQSCKRQRLKILDGDILVFTQKIISKAEGQLVPLGQTTPSRLAKQFGREAKKDPRTIEVVLSEARRVVKMERGVLITETHHGWVCAHAGVDASNVPEPDTVALLPKDPDRSAAKLRQQIQKRLGVRVAIIISDTFGRPWREGLTNVAIGVSGMDPFIDYRGRKDPHGRPLTATLIAAVDELASAAELVMGKLDRVPVALIRGFSYKRARGKAKDIIRPAERDLFR